MSSSENPKSPEFVSGYRSQLDCHKTNRPHPNPYPKLFASSLRKPARQIEQCAKQRLADETNQPADGPAVFYKDHPHLGSWILLHASPDRKLRNANFLLDDFRQSTLVASRPERAPGPAAHPANDPDRAACCKRAQIRADARRAPARASTRQSSLQLTP